MCVPRPTQSPHLCIRACSKASSLLLEKIRAENGGKERPKVAGHMPGYAVNDR